MLDPREGALFVTENSKNVKINSQHLEKMAIELANKVKGRDLNYPYQPTLSYEYEACLAIPDLRKTILLEITMASSIET